MSDVEAVTSQQASNTQNDKTQADKPVARDAVWYGWAAVDLSIQEGSNDSRLASIAQNIRVMRSLSSTAAVTVRDEELAVIGSVLDLKDPNILPLVMRNLALTKDQGTDLLQRIHRALTPIPPTPPSHRN